jgi:hypothetical protein
MQRWTSARIGSSVVAPVSSLVAQRHRRFLAQRVCGQRRTAQAAALERVLRRLQRVVLNHIALALHAAFALRHSAHVHHEPHRINTSALQPHITPPSLLRVLRERSSEQHGEYRFTQQHWLLRERVLQLQQQRLLLPQAERVVVHRTELRSTYPRVATAVAQPAAVRDSKTEARKTPDTASTTAAARDAARPTNPPAAATWPLPPQELARLTASVSNQVIAQLERRALSARERGGRL